MTAVLNPAFGTGLSGGHGHVITRATSAAGKPQFTTAAPHGLASNATVNVSQTTPAANANDGSDGITVVNAIVFKFKVQAFVGNSTGGLWK